EQGQHSDKNESGCCHSPRSDPRNLSPDVTQSQRYIRLPRRRDLFVISIYDRHVVLYFDLLDVLGILSIYDAIAVVYTLAHAPTFASHAMPRYAASFLCI
ncbi:MAG TPA: hypothetical protein VFN11_10080, partial [Ktedonobacterales bacterium]|nr:hypothetical protein [Ktedonobacterales bacterium]